MPEHAALLREIDNYQDTVFGLLAFLNECGWSPEKRTVHPELHFGVGRRMDTSPHNNVSPNATVTPDLIVQKEDNSGVVAEVKHSWPSTSAWDDAISQIEKYDDDLLGWWTDSESLAEPHELVLLVHGSQAVKVSDFVGKAVDAGRHNFARKPIIVGYQRTEQVQQFIQLRREYGRFRNQAFDTRMRQIVPVPVDKIVWRDRRFCDHPPPIPFLMVMLWDDIFDSLAEQVDQQPGQRYTGLVVAVDEIARQLQTYYGFVSDGRRNPGIPRPQWVREVLEYFVRLRLAHKNDDRYVIHYRRFRGDKLVRFGRWLNKLSASKARRRGLSRMRRRGRDDSSQGRLF